MSVRMVLITTPRQKGEEIACHLLEKKLCACVNLVEKVQSRYWWDGKIAKEEESLLMVKTTLEKWPALLEEVTEIHPYEVPEILVLPVAEGYQPYLDWVEKECR